METVIKVSGNKRQEPEPKEEPKEEPVPAPPPEPAQEESTIESIIHHSWGHRHARKEIPVVSKGQPALMSWLLCCMQACAHG